MKHWLILFSLIILFSCKKEEETDDLQPVPLKSLVNFTVSDVPYQKLSDYHFFEGDMAQLEPTPGVLPYDVISPLFSDYSKKKRFVWMPDSVKATYTGDHSLLHFPESTVLIKSFYYKHVQPDDEERIIETRLEFLRNGIWEFAEYVWNEDQSDAYLDMNGSNLPISWINENDELMSVDYRIPSASECLTCHKRNEKAEPIGPKPQNINSDYLYVDGVRNQLIKWVEERYLESDYPSNIVTTVPWDDPNEDLTERVRSYIDMNCAHCHRDNSHCDYKSMRFAFEETLNLENLGVCVIPDDDLGAGQNFILNGGNVNRSLLYYRMNSIEPSIRMPLLGRNLKHKEGLELIKEYINSLPPC